MTFKQATMAKAYFFRERNMTGEKIKTNTFIVPHNEQQFNFYLRSILKLELGQIKDETAIEFCTNDRYGFAQFNDVGDAINYKRFFLKDGVNRECTMNKEDLVSRSKRFGGDFIMKV